MLRVIVKMTLIFVLAYAGVKVSYNSLENYLLSSVPEVKVAQTRPAVKKVEILRKPHDYKIIFDRNIFGAALDETDIVEDAAPVEELQVTKLKLALMGTVSGDERGSRAIISDETARKQDIYAIGDTVQGALIKSIERRRVVLNVNGRDEVLDIKERKGGRAADTRMSSPSPPAERQSLRDRMSLRRPLVRPEPQRRPHSAPRSLGERGSKRIGQEGVDGDMLETDMEMTDEDLLEGGLQNEDIKEPELLDEEQ